VERLVAALGERDGSENVQVSGGALEAIMAQTGLPQMMGT
jgi:hypothetical protein